MASFTFTANTYAGDVLAGYMASTLLEADSVKRGLLTVIPDVKKRKVLLNVDDDVVLQNPNATFTDQGTTAKQDESYLDPVKYEFMKEETWDNLRLSWEADQLKPGSLADYEGVVELSDFVAARYMTKIQIANERLYWLGKAATKEAQFTADYPGILADALGSTGAFKINITGAGKSTYMASTGIAATGIVTVTSTAALRDGDVVSIKATAAAGALTETTVGGTNNAAMLNNLQSYFITVINATTFQLVRNFNDINTRVNATFTGTATAADVTFVNESNVLSVLGSVYSQIDYADRMQEDFNLQIPLHIGYAYAKAQAAAATNVLNAFPDPKKMDYLGIKLQLMNHWKANTIFGARSSNVFLGVDLLGDESHFSTVYLAPYTNDNKVRTKASMKSDTTIKFYNETLILSPQ